MLRGELLSGEERDALAAAARVVLLSRHGTLAQQVLRLLRRRSGAARPAQPVPAPPPAADLPPPRIPLEFFNGLGGFSEDGGEYVTILGERQWTPAPWINVLANSSFGCLVSESGSGYTWAVNSRENQLTPWSNDPVSDPPGEALFLRDEETGEVWSPTPLPIRDDGSYVVRHGQGYSRFEYEHHGIATDLLVFVPREDPVKISRLVVENRSGGARTLTVTAYAEWVLGPQRGAAAPVRRDRARPRPARSSRATPGTRPTPGRVAFADVGGPPDRVDGRSHRVPRAQRRPRRAGGAGAAAPSSRGAPAPASIPAPCCRCGCASSPGQRAQVVFLLGQGRRRRRGAAARRRAIARRTSTPRSPRCGASGRTRSPRSRSARPTARWT